MYHLRRRVVYQNLFVYDLALLFITSTKKTTLFVGLSQWKKLSFKAEGPEFAEKMREHGETRARIRTKS